MGMSDFRGFAVILLGLSTVCLVVIARGVFAIRDAIASKSNPPRTAGGGDKEI